MPPFVPNEYKVVGDITYIYLTHGKVAVIDTEDYPKVKDCRWCAVLEDRYWYVRTIGRKTSAFPRKNMYLHRLITDADPGSVVDHKNFDTMDNRKANLRIVTHAENTNHVSPVPRKNSTTGIPNVAPIVDYVNGRPYYSYKVAVQRYGRKLVAKFPQTPEGLARAIAKAEEFRQQLAGRAAK